MTDPLREALLAARGSTLPVPVAAERPEPKTGNLGGGRGGTAGPARKPSQADTFNAAVRAAAGIVRGHSTTLDDLMNGWSA